MRCWLHRISHHAETSWPLLESGYLTIGFSDLSSPEFFNRTLTADGLSDLDDDIREVYDSLLRSRHSLWRFLREMCIGDFVLVPGWGTYSVYVIEGDPQLIGNITVSDLRTWNGEGVGLRDNLLYAGGRPIDLGFFRRVRLHRIGSGNGPEAKDINRYEYADNGLAARMRIRQTNADISDLADNIERLLEAYGRGTPPNLHARIMEEMREKILKLRTLAKIDH